MELTVDVRSFEGYEALEQIVLACDDLKAENSAAGEKVFPVQKPCEKDRGRVSDGGSWQSVMECNQTEKKLNVLYTENTCIICTKK